MASIHYIFISLQLISDHGKTRSIKSIQKIQPLKTITYHRNIILNYVHIIWGGADKKKNKKMELTCIVSFIILCVNRSIADSYSALKNV